MHRLARAVWFCAAGCLLAAAPVASVPSNPEWNRPVQPFRIIGNVHYVGTNELGAYLITTPGGHILVDGGFEDTAPLVLASIRTLGFDPKDVHILLTTQAHADHVGSLAAFASATGGRVMVMDADAGPIERGGRADFAFGDDMTFPPVRVDRVLHDGDTVSIGATTMTAHLTAGHTRGCTTWTLDTDDAGVRRHVTIAGSLTVIVPEGRLAKAPAYPGIVEDFERSFEAMRALPTDVFLAAHAQFFDLEGKAARRRDGASPNPFIDPQGYRAYIDRLQRAFEERMANETQAKK